MRVRPLVNPILFLWVMFTVDLIKPGNASTNELPVIYTDYVITTEIRNVYSRTSIDLIIENQKNISTETQLEYDIPKNAFITSLKWANDKWLENFAKAYVLEKDEAEKVYNSSVQQGILAGILATKGTTLRGSDKILFRLQMTSKSFIRVVLTYEELLVRRNSRYTARVPLMPIKGLLPVMNDSSLGGRFKSNIKIREETPLLVETTELPKIIAMAKESEFDEINEYGEYENTEIISKPVDGINWILQSHNGSADLNMDGKSILSLIEDSVLDRIVGLEIEVVYDKYRPHESTLRKFGSFFMHAFVPSNLERPPRHVTFVLDRSGSMWNRKLEQLKNSMIEILSDIDPKRDRFNIITFNESIEEWHPQRLIHNNRRYELRCNCSNQIITEPYPFTEQNKNDANEYLLGLEANGWTDIKSALVKTIKQVQSQINKEIIGPDFIPMIIFMTDGWHNGIHNRSTIVPEVNSLMNSTMIPIFTLGFGRGADEDLLKNLSSVSKGRYKKIYEASDATDQLTNYYNEISSPLLNSLEFTYTGDTFDDATTNKFGVYFRGEEKIIISKIVAPKATNEFHAITIKGLDRRSEVVYSQTIPSCENFINSTTQNVSTTLPGSSNTSLPINSTKVSPKKIMHSSNNFTAYKMIMNNGHKSPANTTPSLRPFCFTTTNDAHDHDTSEEDEAFLERMWAFTKIRDYMRNGDEDLDQRREAIELALKYGFVTPFTNLIFSKDKNFTKIMQSSSVYSTKPTDTSDPTPPEIFFDSPTTQNAPNVSLDTENCSIELFPDSYFRSSSAENMMYNSPIQETKYNITTTTRLRVPTVTNRILSFKNKGDCCWRFYQGTDYTGYYKDTNFQIKQYKSATWFGPKLVAQVRSFEVVQCK